MTVRPESTSYQKTRMTQKNQKGPALAQKVLILKERRQEEATYPCLEETKIPSREWVPCSLIPHLNDRSAGPNLSVNRDCLFVSWLPRPE